jgi:hypothetical protein
MHDFLEAGTSYIVAVWAILYTNIDSIVSWGGLLLLFIRLIADAPRAYKVLKDTYGKDSNDQ